MQNGLYYANSLYLLERLHDYSIDLVYIDPPDVDELGVDVTGRVLRQFWRVLKRDGNLLVHTKQGKDTQFLDLIHQTFGRQNAREEIILPTNLEPPDSRYEYIRRYAKSSARLQDDLTEMVWGYKAYESKPMRPIGLIETLIEHSSTRGEFVLDTFCGSGTTLVAAQNTGRKWIGCDINPECVEQTRDRLLTTSANYQSGDENFLRRYEPIRSSVYPNFFISYAHDDMENYILPICEEFKREYIYYWRDKEHILPGNNWREKLDEAITSCDALILFATTTSLNSPYVQYEWQRALTLGRTIIPVLCDIDAKSLPEEIRDKYQAISYLEQQEILKYLKVFKPSTQQNI